MKAATVRRFGPIEDVRIEERPEPIPGAGEVVVEIVAAEVNFPDILVIEGKYQLKPPLPFSPGKAGAGRVVRLGPGANGIAVGDRVAVQVEYGTYAEAVVARAEQCFPIPDGIDFVTAAALGLAYQTAYFALKDRGAFVAGETVLVLGATGGVGMASLQLAKAFGASIVIGAIRGAAGADIVRRAGADHIVDATDANLRDRLKNEVVALTRGRGADVVIDPVGGEAHAAALRTLAWRGRLVIVGFMSGEIPAIKSNYLLLKNIAVSGLQWSDYRDRTPARVASAQREIFALHLAGKIASPIALRVPLDDFQQGLRALQDGGVRGRIIIDVATR